ncbi:MAG: VCBS repeat-containing protein [Verrucomicrobiales bacterium]|nr:VCBS repeat-containing protein [Verrucomicrobiales bacterium]
MRLGSLTLLAGLAFALESRGEETPETRPLGNIINLADPANDSEWDTESFSKNAQTQLNLIGDALKNDFATDDRTALATATSPSFASPPLTPPTSEVFSDHTFTVRRYNPAASPAHNNASLESKVAALHSRLSTRPGHSNAKTKIVRVDQKNGTAVTHVYFEASRSGLQLNAIWNVSWQLQNTPHSLPLISAINILTYEETESANTPGSPNFSDCTESLFAHLDAYNQQLAYGANHWYGNLDGAFGVNQANQGIAVADVNSDGLEDIYLCQPGGLPNRLFIRSKDGSLHDHTAVSGLGILDISRSALFIDLDADGDQDFVVGHSHSISVHEGDGFANFTHRATIDLFSRVSGISAADYDNDGDLDIYVCGYSPKGQMGPTDIFANPVPYHDANNGALNYLLANQGNFDFTDATQPADLNHNNTRYSFTATWEDFDNDGDQDIYVANDFGRNNLYRNNLVPSGSATFTDVAEQLAAEDIAAGMSVAWGDYNNDGNMDLYVSNMWSSAGNRIAFQDQFKPAGDSQTLPLFQRHARGNSLFKNIGQGTPFEDVSVTADVTMGRWAWGSLFADLNNDGWEDLYVTNGFMTAAQSGDL